MPQLEKISVRLFKGDMARLQAKYPRSGASAALRQLLRNHLNKVDEKPPPLEITFEPLANIELEEEPENGHRSRNL